MSYRRILAWLHILLIGSLLVGLLAPLRATRAAGNPPAELKEYTLPGEQAVELKSVKLDGNTYRVYLFTTQSNPGWEGGELFFSQNEYNWQSTGIQAILVLDERSKPVIDETLLRRVFLASLGGYLARQGEPPTYAPVSDEFLETISRITENPDFQAFTFDKKGMSWLKGEGDEFWYAELLRIFLATPDSTSPAIADFGETVRNYVQEGSTWKDAIDKAIEVGRFANDKSIRELAKKSRKAFEQWDFTSLGKAKIGKYQVSFLNGLDLGVLVINLIYLQELSLERAEMLAQVAELSRQNGLGLSSDLLKAIDKVVAEARDDTVQRGELILQFVKDQAANLGVDLGMAVLKDIFIKWTWQTFGTRVVGHLVAGAFSVVLLAFPISDILFGRDAIYENSYLTQSSAKLAREMQQALTKLRDKVSPGSDYAETDELYRNLTIWYNLSSAQVFRSWGTVMQSGRLLTALINFLDPNWENDARNFLEVARQADQNTENNLVRPGIVEYAIVLALSRASIGLEALTATVFVIDNSSSMDNNDPTGGSKLDSAKRAMGTLLRMIRAENQALGPINQFALITFSDSAMTQASMGINLTGLELAVQRMSPQSGTNMIAALEEANTALATMKDPKKKIIVLMSDGVPTVSPNLSGSLTTPFVRSLEAEVLDGPVASAKSQQHCIYSIGFGDPTKTDRLDDGSDYPQIDRQFLESIATQSGCGQYLNAQDANQLVKVYIKFHHESLGNLLTEQEGTITEGETTEPVYFKVPSQQDALICNVTYPGSQINLILKDPAGKVVDENYPGATISEDVGVGMVTITKPRSGRWSYSLYGESLPAGGEPYYVVASTRQTSSSSGSSKTWIWIATGAAVLCCCGVSITGLGGGLLWYRRRQRAGKRN